jgi:hypothetical protein
LLLIKIGRFVVHVHVLLGWCKLSVYVNTNVYIISSGGSLTLVIFVASFALLLLSTTSTRLDIAPSITLIVVTVRVRSFSGLRSRSSFAGRIGVSGVICLFVMRLRL